MIWMSYCYSVRSVLNNISFQFPKAVAMVTLGTGDVTDAVRILMWPVSEKIKEKQLFDGFSCCIIGNQDNHIVILVPYNNAR